MPKPPDRPESDRPTPIPIHVRRALAQRVSDLEEAKGAIMRELGTLATDKTELVNRIRALEHALEIEHHEQHDDDEEERPSQVDGSIRPNHGRISIRGYPPWVVVTIFVVAIIGITTVFVVWILKK